MSTERVDLRGSSVTLLWTLYLRARDARCARPVLGDRHAAEVIERIDYDFSKLRLLTTGTATIAARARCFDTWTEQFLTTYPHGQVLHLGCGLDSRPLRVSLPATTRWIDVDFPEVIDLRQRLYDFPSSVDSIASSVTDSVWWDEVSRDLPTLVLCEGLLMYLRGQDVHTLLDRAVDTLPSGRIAFDAVAPWAVSASRYDPRLRCASTRFSWGYRRTEFESRHPGLVRRDERGALDLAGTHARNPALRACYRPLSWVPPMRDAMRLHHFTFGR